MSVSVNSASFCHCGPKERGQDEGSAQGEKAVSDKAGVPGASWLYRMVVATAGCVPA